MNTDSSTLEATFYLQRDGRTAEVLGRPVSAAVPVHLVGGSIGCTSRAGQVLLLALANQVARVHRTVTLQLANPRAHVTGPGRHRAKTIGDAILAEMRSIDPFGRYSLSASPLGGAVTLAVGPDVPPNSAWYVGARRSIGTLGAHPQQLDTECPGTVVGAAVASCLGAGAIFRTVHGLSVRPRRLSCWNLREALEADEGPEVLVDADPGRVLLVGAGAVAAALAYWVEVLGIGGSWSVIDADIVKLHNTNRGLLFTPQDAGWGGGRPRNKVELLASRLPGGRPDAVWYSESSLAREVFDLIIPVANEHDVRTAVAGRNATVTLHASTGGWTSQLHRHIVGIDDCIRCRMREIKAPSMQCAIGQVPTVKESGVQEHHDAALPFVSAASGLMLAAALLRLCSGELADGPANEWRWYWDSDHLAACSSVRVCADTCAQIQPRQVRHAMNRDTRWSHLDREDLAMKRPT